MIHATTKRIDWNTVKDTLRAAQKVHEQSSTIDAARMQEIFHQRALRLAAGNTHAQSAAATTPVLVFGVGDETYGVELQYVAQVFPNTRITPVPGAPEGLMGIANLQGEVRSVFGLRRLLTPSGGDDATNRYILLLRHDSRHVGLQVERIDEVRQIVLDNLSEHEDASADKHAGYINGVTYDKVIMLRADRLFEL